jgi:hypothetical protein
VICSQEVAGTPAVVVTRFRVAVGHRRRLTAGSGATVRNASDEFLFIPGTEDRCRSQRWSEAAVALAMQLRDLMDPIADGWVDNEMHFTTLNLKPGVCAP